MNVPAMPVSSSSISAMNALVRPGSGTYRQRVDRAQEREQEREHEQRQEIPSIPTW